MIDTWNIKEITKTPKGVEWLARYKSENFWSRAQVGILGGDAYIRLQGKGLKTRLFIILDFRSKNERCVLLDIYNYTDSSDAHPFGLNFSYCLDKLVDMGMKTSYKE